MTKRTIDDYFRIIKENHKKYLEYNMVTHLELTGSLANAKLIKRYAENIELFRPSKERYLDSAIQQLSTASKVGHGALAALLGMGVGGFAFYAQQGISPMGMVNPLPDGKNVVAGAFSAVLAAGVSYLAYKAWEKSAENPAAADYQKFQEMMQKGGFTNEKYAELSADLVKLFHYRECLLLGLKDSADNDLREEFKKKYSPDGVPYDEEALNKAIEVYFLDQLNILFNNAFKKIYVIHDSEIKEDQEQYQVMKWLKGFFESPDQRAKFTQQMQVEFMKQCLNYLEAQMTEPSFFAKYPYATASVTGLIAGAVAIGLAAAIVGGPIGIGIVSIGLVIACVSAVASYFAVNKIDALHYKRGKENRDAIQQAIDDVTKESERLNRLIQNVVETTPDDIRQLEKYKGEGEGKGFLHFFNLFGKTKNIAMGAETAWVREHASRYRHSKMIEIDLSQQHREIIEKGRAQTAEMQQLLNQIMAARVQTTLPRLKSFIDDTKAYLSDIEKNQDFITKFDLVNKIKQQMLEIVAAVPADSIQKELPKELVDFYTLPVKSGGLGGLAQDLEKARQLAPIAPEGAIADRFHPLHKLLITAQRFNYALSQDKNREFILMGDATYRAMLGLRVDNPSERIENKINAGNIQQYLNQSFDFLMSLNKPVNAADIKSNLDKPFLNSNEFALYRMLLIRQLASLADPNNLRVEPSVRRDIENFAREKLQIDPKVTFDDVLNQSLFITEDEEGPTITDPLGVPRFVNDLDHVADALRFDIAYSSQPMTPRKLITLEVNDFLLSHGSEKTMFCYKNSKNELTPEASSEYVSRITDVIATTKELIAQMGTKNVLFKSGALASYIHDAHQEVKVIRKQIQSLTEMVQGPTNLGYLQEADRLLNEYQGELELILDTSKPERLEDSILQFGAFGKKKAALDLSLFEDWEVLTDPIMETEKTIPEKLDVFRNAINLYIEKLKDEPEIGRFNFINYSKKQKLEAAQKLLSALIDVKDGKAVDLKFLDDKIYNNGRLGTIISEHVKLFKVANIKQVFASVQEFLAQTLPKNEASSEHRDEVEIDKVVKASMDSFEPITTPPNDRTVDELDDWEMVEDDQVVKTSQAKQGVHAKDDRIVEDLSEEFEVIGTPTQEGAKNELEEDWVVVTEESTKRKTQTPASERREVRSTHNKEGRVDDDLTEEFEVIDNPLQKEKELEDSWVMLADEDHREEHVAHDKEDQTVAALTEEFEVIDNPPQEKREGDLEDSFVLVDEDHREERVAHDLTEEFEVIDKPSQRTKRKLEDSFVVISDEASRKKAKTTQIDPSENREVHDKEGQVDVLTESEFEVIDAAKDENDTSKKLDAFIKSLKEYIEVVRSEPEIHRFNFFSYSKKQKEEAADKLMNALINLKEGQPVDAHILDDKIYTDGRLNTIIAENVRAFGVTNIKQIFSDIQIAASPKI